LNCVACLTLPLAVLLSVSLSCTFHTLHHQLVVHDDTEDKSWSATKKHMMWLLKLELFLSAELNGLTEICKISLMQKMEGQRTNYTGRSKSRAHQTKQLYFAGLMHKLQDIHIALTINVYNLTF
jgi:hypothetical protein